MTWEANPDFARMAIREGMDVNITITAPEGIADFVIDVDSNILGPVLASPSFGGTTNTDGTVRMDLIKNATMVSVLGGMGVPTGDSLADQKEVVFSLSSLVPMILDYGPAQGSEHTFTLKVTDNKNQSLEKPVVFYAE